MTLPRIACLGLSHESAPVELRERLSCAIAQEEHKRAADLSSRFAAMDEVAMLVTCNRIELYATIDDAEVEPRQLMVEYLSEHHSESTSELHRHFYFLRGERAVEHLLRVACGLESQILGEPQILGQVTSAYMDAVEAGTIGSDLTTLFRGAIRAGKRARANTSISSKPASIASVSISLADQLVGPLYDRHVLVVGLGEMAQLAISALRKRNVEHISLANRTAERAVQQARSWNGVAYGLEQLALAMSGADVVVTATAAPSAVIDSTCVLEAMRHRRQRDLVIIDIALPRDVDPAVRGIPGVHLFNMDDLRQSLDRALEARRREVPRVETLIAEEMDTLIHEFRELVVSPVIVDLRQKAEAIRQRELQRTLRFIGEDVDPQTLKHVQHLSRSLVNKLLHEPTVRLRQKASNGQADPYASAVCELFDLDVDGES